MRLVYALPLLILTAIAWLFVRHALEQRRARRYRERLKRQPTRPKFKPRSDSERSEMRAYDDATTVATTLKKREPKPSEGEIRRSSDGTRAKAKL